jgi:hypothetical protein
VANRLPKNPGSYSPDEVPANGLSASRFLLPAGPSGWPTDSPAESVAETYRQLTEERLEAAEPITEAPVVVELKYVRRDREAGWHLVRRGSVTGRPTLEPTRPGRFSRGAREAGALLDDVFLGGQSYAQANDEKLWNALLTFCETEQPRGRVVRQLNDSLAVLILLRAGLEVKASSLPQRHLEAAAN